MRWAVSIPTSARRALDLLGYNRQLVFTGMLAAASSGATAESTKSSLK